MPWAVAILLFALLALSITSAVYYGVILLRIIATARRLPTALDGLDLPGPPGGAWPSLCIVIPAHNEEEVIGALARSLAAQEYPDLRIVFSLDRCTDGTESAVREAMRGSACPWEIVQIAQCAEGWAGKTHAAWRGVQDSVGARGARLLLFADADTVFAPGLSRAAAALLEARGLDLLSLLAELTHETWFEKLVQPAAGFELIRQYPLDFVNRQTRPRAFANGQFMLFRRETYDAIGGHEAVKHELLEDIAFARRLEKRAKSTPTRWNVLMPGGLLRCRMYRSWEAFVRGWKRIYTEASLRRPRQLAEWAWRNRFAGALLPHSGSACIAGGAAAAAWSEAALLGWILISVGAVSAFITLAAIVRIYRDQGAPLLWCLAYPIGAWITSNLLAEAASDLRSGRRTIWGGRTYAREAQP